MVVLKYMIVKFNTVEVMVLTDVTITKKLIFQEMLQF